jgi:SSS family solute:Na+ symporter
MDIAIIIVYLGAMLAFGWWGKTRTSNAADFLVAGRRLGPVLYTGTMSALVLGGASTVGGVGLGYTYGLSGMWLVVAIAVGVLLLSVAFAGKIQRLRIYTVAQMLQLRYGVGATSASSLVMVAYTLMLSVTSTIAYATVFNVLFGTDRTLSVIIGGAVVMTYSAIGGMWSITITDMVQFLLQTVGIFFLMLPFTWQHAGGLDGHQGARGGHRLRPRRDRYRDHRDVLRDLHLRDAHRSGHLAACVHRPVTTGGSLGRHRVGHLLPAVRRRRRPHRRGRLDLRRDAGQR